MCTSNIRTCVQGISVHMYVNLQKGASSTKNESFKMEKKRLELYVVFCNKEAEWFVEFCNKEAEWRNHSANQGCYIQVTARTVARWNT